MYGQFDKFGEKWGGHYENKYLNIIDIFNTAIMSIVVLIKRKIVDWCLRKQISSFMRKPLLVWLQNGDLGLGWVLEYIQRFIVDSGRWDPTYHKSD